MGINTLKALTIQVQEQPTPPKAQRAKEKVRSINIRGVPEEIWAHARVNAAKSRLPFSHYLIKLLAASRPIEM